MVAPSGPDDAKEVVCAIRLGWAMAEVRARYQGSPAEPATASDRVRASTFLPLARERSPAELAIEAEAVVVGLARGLGLDFDLTHLSGEREDRPEKASDRLTQLTRKLAEGYPEQLAPFSHFLYAWDAKIQDTLAAGSFSQATGYLLGRGLGEVSWGPELAAAAGEPGDWSSFLGPERRDQLVQSLEGLSSYFHPLTVVAIRSSLAAWGAVATDPEWRAQAGMNPALKEQSHLWRDLLLGNRDPELLVAPHWSLQKAQTEGRVLAVFLPQMIVAGVGIGLLSGAAWVLANPALSSSHDLGGVLAVLGFFGVTGAGLHAHAKNSALQLLSRMRLAYETDLVAEQATQVPPKLTRRPVRLARSPSPIDAAASLSTPVQLEGGNHANAESPSESREQREEVTAGQPLR